MLLLDNVPPGIVCFSEGLKVFRKWTVQENLLNGAYALPPRYHYQGFPGVFDTFLQLKKRVRPPACGYHVWRGAGDSLLSGAGL